MVPTLLLTLVLWACLLFCSHWAEKIKRDHDLATYREVLDFWNGVEPNRDTERGRRERAILGWMRAVRSVGMVVLAAARNRPDLRTSTSRQAMPRTEAVYAQCREGQTAQPECATAAVFRQVKIDKYVCRISTPSC